MPIKLYVGGVNYRTTVVSSARIIMDKMTGRSRGFGFVEMATEAEANAAIDMWNGKELDGRTLIVNIARPMEERAPRRDFGGGGRDDRGGQQGGGDRGGYSADRGPRRW
jgi:cold-inducible RNA-binding protein